MRADRPSTVRQLLATPVLAAAKVLGGEDGLDRAAVDIVLRSTISRTNAPPAGSLVVVDGAALDDHVYRVDHALRVLSECGGVGLIVADPRRGLDAGPARLANQFRIPFMAIEGVTAVELAFSLRAAFWAADVEQAAVLSRFLDELSLARHRSAEVVLERAAACAGASFGLLDRTRHTVSGAAIDITGRRLAEQVGHHADHGGDGVLHSAPIVLSPGEPIAYWVVALSSGPAVSDRVLQGVVQICGWYLASLLASTRMRHEREARRRIAVLNEVLESGERSERDLLGQLAEMGWTVTGWNMGVHIKLGGISDPSRVVDLHAEISERLDRAGVRGPVVERTDGWSCWTTVPREPSVETYAQLTAAVADALSAFVAAHPGLTGHAGIGRPYPDVGGLRRTLGEAHEASLIAVAQLRGTSGAAHIDQLGVQRVLMGWFGSDEFKTFAESMLAPLTAADHDHTLLHTLEVFLDTAGSSTAAAVTLGVHRNTITNRIRRVEELLRVDLTDAEVRLSLQLACRMVRLNS